MISHRLELFSELNCLVEACTFFRFISLYLDSPLLQNILELCHSLLVFLELHIVLCLSKGSDQLAACLTTSSEHLKI